MRTYNQCVTTYTPAPLQGSAQGFMDLPHPDLVIGKTGYDRTALPEGHHARSDWRVVSTAASQTYVYYTWERLIFVSQEEK